MISFTVGVGGALLIGRHTVPFQHMLSIVFTLGVSIFGVLTVARWAFRQLQTNADVGSQSESASLLLQEYEQRGVGWLWQVDAENRVSYIFAIFGTLRMIMMKQMGVGLGLAVLIDATVIRGVLLPASMKLLGEWNWYLPRWLEWVPSLTPEQREPRAPRRGLLHGHWVSAIHAAADGAERCALRPPRPAPRPPALAPVASATLLGSDPPHDDANYRSTSAAAAFPPAVPR